jgi:hypothetical protein
MALDFAYEVSLITPVGFFNTRKILRHYTEGFTSPPKEVALRIFIAIKNP